MRALNVLMSCRTLVWYDGTHGGQATAPAHQYAPRSGPYLTGLKPVLQTEFVKKYCIALSCIGNHFLKAGEENDRVLPRGINNNALLVGRLDIGNVVEVFLYFINNVADDMHVNRAVGAILNVCPSLVNSPCDRISRIYRVTWAWGFSVSL